MSTPTVAGGGPTRREPIVIGRSDVVKLLVKLGMIKDPNNPNLEEAINNAKGHELLRKGFAVAYAGKIIIPVGNFRDGNAPMNPETGRVLTNWQGNPRTGTGAVFHNPKDDTYQFVSDDGSGVIIINEGDRKKAEEVIKCARECGWRDDLQGFETRQQVEEFIKRVKDKHGVDDIYDSDLAFVERKLEHPEDAGDASKLGKGGYMLKMGGEVLAFYVPPERGRTIMYKPDGKGGTVQKGTTGKGLVILIEADPNKPAGGEVRGIQVDAFEEGYVGMKGKAIDVNELPKLLELLKAN